jgi:hypothetical protein
MKWSYHAYEQQRRAHATQIALATGVATRLAPPETKINLFRSLFRGWDDAYAVRWDGKNGKSGYAPACVREWDRQFCKKPLKL